MLHYTYYIYIGYVHIQITLLFWSRKWAWLPLIGLLNSTNRNVHSSSEYIHKLPHKSCKYPNMRISFLFLMPSFYLRHRNTINCVWLNVCYWSSLTFLGIPQWKRLFFSLIALYNIDYTQTTATSYIFIPKKYAVLKTAYFNSILFGESSFEMLRENKGRPML